MRLLKRVASNWRDLTTLGKVSVVITAPIWIPLFIVGAIGAFLFVSIQMAGELFLP
jgi:hypothetical protein